MMSLRTITAVVASAAVAGGGLAAPAFSQTAGTYPGDASSSSQSNKPGKRGHHGKRHLTDAQLTTVATALGTTLDGLKAAQAKVKAAVAATDAKETKAEKDGLLAAELNVTVTQLRAAFASVRGTTDGMCKGKARPSTGTGSGTYPTDAPAA
jgi:hypothetical protein